MATLKEAQQAWLDGKRVRSVDWNKGEFVYRSANGRCLDQNDTHYPEFLFDTRRDEWEILDDEEHGAKDSNKNTLTMVCPGCGVCNQLSLIRYDVGMGSLFVKVKCLHCHDVSTMECRTDMIGDIT